MPCVFYGDYYGISGEFAQESFQEVLDKLLDIRLNLAYGEQIDYLDDANCIGWTRQGKDDGQPIAVLINNDQATSKSMLVGTEWAGREFSDYLGNSSQIVTIDDQGWGEFPVEEKSVSVWSVR